MIAECDQIRRPISTGTRGPPGRRGGAWTATSDSATRVPEAIALSLLAAFLFAASAAMQQHAVHTIDAPRSAGPASFWRSAALPVLRLARRLSRSRLWLAGIVANVSGSLVQASALHFGSVAVVQVLLVTQLMFTLPLGSVWDRRWPAARDWLSAVAICVGLALFFAVPRTAPTGGNPDRWRIALAVGYAFSLTFVLVVVAAGRPAGVHATLVAVAAGICFAITAVLMKVTLAALLDHGVIGTARDWVGYGLAVATLSGFVLEQEAFAAGSLAAAVAAMTITNPVASYLLGVVSFDISFPRTLSSVTALAGTAMLIGAGVVGLAHSPIVRRDRA